ncbi:hypothetical protein BJY52DRAFT_1232728, partial [Lactarius psammicola]
MQATWRCVVTHSPLQAPLVLLYVNSHVKQLGPLPDGYDRVRCLHSQSSGDHWVPTKRHQTQLCRGMLDIPAELLLVISAHMDHHDLRGLAVTSRFLRDLLLPEYLRRRGLKLKDTCTGGTSVELRDLSGYASLGLWSIVPAFRPPEQMYCSIPDDAQEARSAIGFVTRFLLDPSNTSNLRKFHFSLWDHDPLPIMSELIKLQGLYCVLPLTQLCISGYGSAAYLPPSITLWSGTSCGSHTLTSLYISSDLPFAPGLTSHQHPCNTPQRETRLRKETVTRCVPNESGYAHGVFGQRSGGREKEAMKGKTLRTEGTMGKEWAATSQRRPKIVVKGMVTLMLGGGRESTPGWLGRGKDLGPAAHAASRSCVLDSRGSARSIDPKVSEKGRVKLQPERGLGFWPQYEGG